MSLLSRFYSITTVKRKGKMEPVLDYFCPILPYVRFYPNFHILPMECHFAENNFPRSLACRIMVKLLIFQTPKVNYFSACSDY